jgi:hypothetical protein
VAANCWLLPAGTEAVAGVTEIEVSTAAVTVSVAAPPIVPMLAVIVAVPGSTPVASPLLLTVAIELAEEPHLAVPLRFCVLPLLYLPVAVNCWLFPAATEAVAGVTESEVSTAAVTVNVADPLIAPTVAVIVAVPWATPVANPVALFIVATAVAEDAHLALVVRFCVVPLL